MANLPHTETPLLASRIIAGDIRAAARLMSDIDDEKESALAELKELFHKTGKAHIIGITGAPGAGKSTLVNTLVGELRQRNRSIGVIAVDPTSPFTGGAILGDRIRMQQYTNDEGVFIRSLATRGYMGGVSRATHHIARVMDAMGKDIIIIETVGVGQDEVDIVNMADTSIVVLVPGQGDTIQAIKAGILEIADIFVINKCEREGSVKLEQELKIMLEMAGHHSDFWIPPITKTESIKNVGIIELINLIFSHKKALQENRFQNNNDRKRAEFEFFEILKSDVTKTILRHLRENGAFEQIIQAIAEKEKDPYSAAEEVIKNWLSHT
ncbi:MAG: methylmalonyl Co-A mutase-associated GTPase MeaB [Deltaproteobacteria bacterium]|nr:methylmalonyl Co-A mutase-associated GTPase MeaB [Deltaproteobacteria bacterium]